MTGRRRLWMVLGSTAVAMLLAISLVGEAALAADDSDPTLGQAFVDRLASRLGISSDELTSAVRDTQIEMLDEAVTSRRLTQGQADVMKERIQASEGIAGFGFVLGGRHDGMGMGRGVCFSIDTLAETLGMTTTELRTELEGGATLSEIISAQGQTVDAVVQALVAEAKTHLDEAVAEGRITQEQADSKLAELSARLTDMIENGLPRFGGPERHMQTEERTS